MKVGDCRPATTDSILTRMAYKIRRLDGCTLNDLSAADVLSRVRSGSLWPDEEICAEHTSGTAIWRPISATTKQVMLDAIAAGKAAREIPRVVEGHELTDELRLAVTAIHANDSSGTGFAIDSTGTILTNEHVVSDANRVRVRFESGIETNGRVVMRDQRSDMAIIKCALPTPAHIDLNLRRATSLRQGARAYALGFPARVNQLSITQGLVSAVDVTHSGQCWHQVSAAVNPGNSGGPVLGIHGEFIGIATQRPETTEDGRRAEGIAWAIRYDDVIAFCRDFRRHVDEGKISLPTPEALMRESSRPRPAEELQLAIDRMCRHPQWRFRVVSRETREDGSLRAATVVSADGMMVKIFLDPFPTNRSPAEAPLYIYMYYEVGELPTEAIRSASALLDILQYNATTPHWQFACADPSLLTLRYCRQSDLIDSSEIIHVIEDLKIIINRWSGV